MALRRREGLLGQTIALVAAAVISGLAGCSVGPHFRQPEAPATSLYTSAPLPAETAAAPVPGGEAQRLVWGKEIPAEWWELFRSESLNRLICQAFEGSPTLTAALAALHQAQENLQAQRGALLFPKTDAALKAERQKVSSAVSGQAIAAGTQFDLFNASVNVSYSLDLFGGAHRELEAMQSQVDYQSFLVEAAYLTLTSNVVTTAIKEASLRAQIGITNEILRVQEKLSGIVGRQFELGSVSRTDVLSQQTQLAQTRAAIPPREKALSQTRHSLSVLIGKLPGEASDLPEFDLDGLQLPKELPVSLPSSLVRQRPDIRASEALLHAASAQIGVATANLYPQITLTGNYGSQATRHEDLFGSGTSVWNIAAGLLQPVFHGGELLAKRRAAVAAYDQTAAQYRETVLQAFQNVADVLRALENDARTLSAQAEAEASARHTFDLAQEQFQLGAVSYLSLLNAERQYQQTRIGLVEAQAARFADTAAMFQALGGGWWNRQRDAGGRR
jgi:NodT family efflux transporter outer membrane factor (OMF) lipoprotein